MDLAVAATTFLLVIPAELPDKTFISCVVLSSRYDALPVWIGAASGLVLQAGIAVLAGGLLSLLPHTAVQIVVSVLFLGGALYLLFVPEKAEERKGEQLAEREGRGRTGTFEGGDADTDPATAGGAPAVVSGAGGAPLVAGAGEAAAAAETVPAGRIQGTRGWWSIVFSTFGIIVLAEFGDITQVLIANLSAHYRDPLSVFVGAAVAFCVVSVIGVLAGKLLIRYVPLALVRRISGLALLGLGIYTIVSIA